MNDNYDDIKKKIEDGTPKRPEGLSRENIVELIKSKGIEPQKRPHRVIPFKQILSAVAAVAVIVGAVTAYRNMGFGNNIATDVTSATSAVAPVTTTPGRSVKSVESVKEKRLSGVDSYSEIENYFLSIQKEWKKAHDDSAWV